METEEQVTLAVGSEQLDPLIIYLKSIENLFSFYFITERDFTNDVSTYYLILRNRLSNHLIMA